MQNTEKQNYFKTICGEKSYLRSCSEVIRTFVEDSTEERRVWLENREYLRNIMSGFYWPVCESLGLVFQGSSAGVTAGRRKSQLVLGKEYDEKPFSVDASSLPCNTGKLLRDLEKLGKLDPAPRARLEALGSRAGLAQQRVRRRGLWKQDQQLEEEKKPLFPFCEKLSVEKHSQKGRKMAITAPGEWSCQEKCIR